MIVSWVLSLMLLIGSAHAAETAGTASMATTPAPVDLITAPSPMPFVGQLQIFEDTSGQLDPEAVLAETNWQAATNSTLNRGYSKSAFWLRGTLDNSGSMAVRRWLSVGVARLEDVRFYEIPDGTTTPTVTWVGGNRVPLDSRPVRAAESVFPVVLTPGERATFLVRVQTRSATSMQLVLWQPDDYRLSQETHSMIAMLLAGSMVAIALYTLALGLARRDRVFLLLTGCITLQLLQDLAFQGFLYRYVLTDGGETVLRAPSVLSAVTVACFCLMAMAFAGLDRVTLWRRVYHAMIAGMCAIALWAAFGNLRAAALTLNYCLFACNFVWLVSMIDGWRRGFANARWFLVSFGVNCTTLFLRLAIINGVLPEHLLSGTAMAWSSNISVLLMLTIIVTGRSRELRDERRAVQQALLDARREEQMRLELAVHTRTRELQHALIAADEANGAKSDFLARISHDLRTPLTSIIGFADLVQAGGREDADRGRIIRRSAHHMLTMVNDLIEYAGGGSAPDMLLIAPVYMHAFLDGIAQEGISLASKHENAFLLNLRTPLPPVLTLDAKRVRQVLGNLIHNAAKYTVAGTITLSVACEPTDTPGEMMLTFEIEDSGCGIAPEDRQRVFEPFTRLDRARQLPGVGLGLAIVRQWVTRMSGTLALDSEPGVGTRVRVGLPVGLATEADLAPNALAGTSQALPQVDGEGYHVWLAEDTQEIRHFLNDELASLGFTVETFADGSELMARLDAIAQAGTLAADAPDLVLTDHMMPGAGGLAVLGAVRQVLPEVPVLAVSASPQVDGRYDACLLKPVDLSDLRNTLARLLGLTRTPARPLDWQDGPMHRPGMDDLREARQLIAMGAISDLMDWARDLGESAPQFERFAQRLRHLAQQGDLAGLTTLCEA